MPHFASRSGAAVIALVVTAGLALSSTPVEAAAARAGSKTVLRCSNIHHAHYCVRVGANVGTLQSVYHPVRPGAHQSTGPAAAAGSLVAEEVALVNADRKAAGLPALSESPVLDRIATARAMDMVTTGYFGHYRPGDPTLAVLELLRANGVSFTWYGENIIWESGQPPASIASYFHSWWMNSPEHKANILNAHYGHIGIGVVVSASRVYMVEDFTN